MCGILRQITRANASNANTTCVTEVQTFTSAFSVWGDQDEVGSEDTIPCNFKHATLVTDANGNKLMDITQGVFCRLTRLRCVLSTGNQTCVCSTEWTGAPDCNGYVWWKIVLAALGTLSILVRAGHDA